MKNGTQDGVGVAVAIDGSLYIGRADDMPCPSCGDERGACGELLGATGSTAEEFQCSRDGEWRVADCLKAECQ